VTSEFTGKRVAVIGLAATGLATARVLRDLGATVCIYDNKPETAISPERLAAARDLGDGVTLALNNAPLDWEHTDMVIPSPGVPRAAAPLVLALEHKVPILGEIEVAYRIAKAPILAITGTNGKTTVTALLGAICRESGRETWVAGNIAEDAGVRLPLIEAAVLAPSDGVIVAEISSFQLEWVSTFRPRVAAWLNITSDHLDRHQDFDEYAQAKARLFTAQQETDTAVLNADDETAMQYGQRRGGGERRTFSVRDRVVNGTYLDGDTLLAVRPGAAPVVLMRREDIPLPGLHNVANVLAASAMALAFGITPEAIRTAVRTFAGVAHRLETVATIGGVRYINNSMCTNPAAVAASLEAADGVPVVAISGGQHKGGDLTQMAAALVERTRSVVLIGASAKEIGEALDREARQVEKPLDVFCAATLPEAVEQAASVAAAGDIVMLIPGCASFDMFTGFEHRGQVFRDAVMALSKESTAKESKT
jgi:UDP-N-acetylmuramoylalanine--D-glutamate ligase